MGYYIGVDLGTSSVKLLLVDEAGRILNSASREYPLLFPHPGWSEQEPACWWEAVTEGIRDLTKDVDCAQVRGIGCGAHGQHRLCRLYRAEDPVDAQQGAGEL